MLACFVLIGEALLSMLRGGWDYWILSNLDRFPPRLGDLEANFDGKKAIYPTFLASTGTPAGAPHEPREGGEGGHLGLVQRADSLRSQPRCASRLAALAALRLSLR